MAGSLNRRLVLQGFSLTASGISKRLEYIKRLGKTMGFIGGKLGRTILNRFSPPGETSGERPAGETSDDSPRNPETFPFRLQRFFGQRFCEEIRGKTVADFGCGAGRDVVEMVLRGAASGIGLELRADCLDKSRRLAAQYGVDGRCLFVETSRTPADIVISVDAFEHFDDPENMLNLMAGCLSPGGVAWISFGPPWYHPKGGHLFSVFPWAHLIFTEKALIEWRKQYRNDGATKFGEVAGGLNRMSVGRFRRLIRRSRFEIDVFETIPIKGIRPLNNPATREFFASVVRCRLHLKEETVKGSK